MLTLSLFHRRLDSLKSSLIPSTFLLRSRIICLSFVNDVMAIPFHCSTVPKYLPPPCPPASTLATNTLLSSSTCPFTFLEPLPSSLTYLSCLYFSTRVTKKFALLAALRENAPINSATLRAWENEEVARSRMSRPEAIVKVTKSR